MKYDECLQVLSPARLNKYAQASGNEKAKTCVYANTISS